MSDLSPGVRQAMLQAIHEVRGHTGACESGVCRDVDYSMVSADVRTGELWEDVQYGDSIVVMLNGVVQSNGKVVCVKTHRGEGRRVVTYRTDGGIESKVGIPPSGIGMAVHIKHDGNTIVWTDPSSTIHPDGCKCPAHRCEERRMVAAMNEQFRLDREQAKREADKPSRHEQLIDSERRLIIGLGEAGYRSPWYVQGPIRPTMPDSPSLAQLRAWRSARNEFVAAREPDSQREALDRMLGAVTDTNPPLAADVATWERTHPRKRSVGDMPLAVKVAIVAVVAVVAWWAFLIIMLLTGH